MKISENLSKSMKIYEIQFKKIYKIRGKSSEDKKPAWNRAKVSTGSAGRYLPMKDLCSEIHENLWKSMKNLWKSYTSYENHANLGNTMQVLKGQEASLESSTVSIGSAGRYLPMKDPCSEIHENRWESMKDMKIHVNVEKSSKIYENLENL